MKAKVTITAEYRLQPEFYPKNMPPEEMAEMDEHNFYDDPVLFIEQLERDGNLKIKIEPEEIK